MGEIYFSLLVMEKLSRFKFYEKNNWIGFCQYRKFWSTKNDKLLPNSIDEIKL